MALFPYALGTPSTRSALMIVNTPGRVWRDSRV